MAESGKPTTSGKKPRKGATKKASKHIHSIIENASELQFKNRAPVNEATSTRTTHEQSTVLSTSVAAQMPAFSVPQSSKTTQRRFNSAVESLQPSNQLCNQDNTLSNSTMALQLL